MAERNEADIADQQVEGAGEQRENSAFRRIRVKDQRRPANSATMGTNARSAHLRVEAAFGRGGSTTRSITRSVRTAGRPMSSTTTMMTKIIVPDASGKNTLVTPRDAERKAGEDGADDEPMPPITTTANTTMMRSEPICGATRRSAPP